MLEMFVYFFQVLQAFIILTPLILSKEKNQFLRNSLIQIKMMEERCKSILIHCSEIVLTARILKRMFKRTTMNTLFNLKLIKTVKAQHKSLELKCSNRQTNYQKIIQSSNIQSLKMESFLIQIFQCYIIWQNKLKEKRKKKI